MNALCGVVRFDGGTVAPAELEPMFSALPGLSGGTTEHLSVDGAVFGLSRYEAGADCGLVMDGESLAMADGFVPPGIPTKEPGFFAVARWDSVARSLELTRDAMGRRSLYWARRGEQLWFATEPRQILAASGLDPAPDLQRLLAYLVLTSPAVDRSFFRSVRRLPEGARLRVSPQGELCQRSGPRFPVESPVRNRQRAAEELAARLAQSVEECLPVSGRTGVLLSGGLDSSAIAALATRREDLELTAFSWIGDGLNERDRSSRLLEKYPTIKEQVIDGQELWPLSLFPSAYGDANAPLDNAFPDLLWKTLETARLRETHVLLNGLGGDSVAGWSVPDLALLVQGQFAALWRRAKASGRGMLRVLVQQVAALWRWSPPTWLTPQARQRLLSWKLDRPPISLSDLLTARRFRLSQLSSFSNSESMERLDRLSRASGVRMEAPWLHASLASLALAVERCGLAVTPPTKEWVREAMRDWLPRVDWKVDQGKLSGTPGLISAGLLSRAMSTIEYLLTGSRLEQLGLIEEAKVLRGHRERVAKGSILPGLWRILTAEAWLRASATP